MNTGSIAIKIEGDEQHVFQLSIPGTTGGTSDAFDTLFGGNEEIASLLGNPSSESLTMYKSEPMDQEDVESNEKECAVEPGTPFPTELLVENQSDTNHEENVVKLEENDVKVETGSVDSSSSSSDSEDDNSTVSEEDDIDSSRSEDEPKDINQSQMSALPASILSENGFTKEVTLFQRENARKRHRVVNQHKQNENEEQEKTLENFVNESIEEYLGRRGFRNPATTVPGTIPKGIFASIILPDSARMNATNFGPNYEASEISAEIGRFWDFYTNLKLKSPTVAVELRQLFVPMLLHFFQECYSNGYPVNAVHIHSTFESRFRNEDKSEEGHISLAKLAAWVAAEPANRTEEFLQSIRRRDFRFVISSKAFEELQNFLISKPSPALTYLFSGRFTFQLEETATVLERFLEAPPIGGTSNQNCWLDSTSDSLDQSIELLSKEPTSSISVSYSSLRRKLSYTNVADNIKKTIPVEFQPQLFDKFQQALRDESLNPNNKKGKKRMSLSEKVIYLLRNSVEANVPSLKIFTLSGNPTCANISKHGTLLAFGMETSVINVCFTSDMDLERFKASQQITPKENSFNHGNASKNETVQQKQISMINTLNGHEGAVYDLVFHPRTQLLFSVGHDGTMRAWDLKTFSCHCVYRGHAYPIWCMDITASGHMIVTGSMDTTARLWIPESTNFVRLFAGHYFDVDCVKFHPNEAYVATGSVDKSVRMWSIADGNLVRVFTGSEGPISSIAFHSNGSYIIGGGDDSIIRIWDIAEGEVLAELPSPIASSPCRQISLNENMLAAAFEDNTVKIWNLRQLFRGKDQLKEDFDSSSTSLSEDDEKYYYTLRTKSTQAKSSQISEKRSESPKNAEEDSDWETCSSCSITEDELEPLEAKSFNDSEPKRRLPAPKIIRCESSAILKLYYQDCSHLYTLGRELERSDAVEKDASLCQEPPKILERMAIQGTSWKEEEDNAADYLPNAVRPLLISAGIHRWPIPVHPLNSNSEDEESQLSSKKETPLKKGRRKLSTQ